MEVEIDINWIPKSKNILVSDDEKNDADTKRLASMGLIGANSLSDAERLKFGGTSKAAEVANATSEEQKIWTIVCTAPDCVYQAGDRVKFMPGCQATSLLVDGKYYLQLGEYEILGKLKHG